MSIDSILPLSHIHVGALAGLGGDAVLGFLLVVERRWVRFHGHGCWFDPVFDL